MAVALALAVSDQRCDGLAPRSILAVINAHTYRYIGRIPVLSRSTEWLGTCVLYDSLKQTCFVLWTPLLTRAVCINHQCHIDGSLLGTARYYSPVCHSLLVSWKYGVAALTLLAVQTKDALKPQFLKLMRLAKAQGHLVLLFTAFPLRCTASKVNQLCAVVGVSAHCGQ